MPAPPCLERSNFFKTDIPIPQPDGTTSNKHVWWICKLCHAAHINNTGAGSPELVRDRADAYRSHLKRCTFHQQRAGSERPNEDTLSMGSSARSVSSVGSGSTTGSAKRQKRMSDFFLSVEEQRSFERDLLEFQSECALPDLFVEHGSAKRLFARIPHFELPSRKELGGCILNSHAKAAEEESKDNLREKQEETGGRVNFVCDDWENVARQHLLACQLILFGCIVQFELLQVGSYHHAIAIAKLMEESFTRAMDQGWEIGSCVTDDAGQCARARRILALRWPNIIFLRCFAHDINNLVKAVLQTVFKVVTKQAASATAAMNGSSGKWLVRANERVIATYGYPLAFITLCETRWNSMQACFASLLRVRSALEDLAHDSRNDPEFPSALNVFRDELFWKNLTDAERVIRPLSEPSFCLQKDENTMAHVVRCFGKISSAFAASPYASYLTPAVEKRWANCEQPLMLLAFALHPLYVTHARSMTKAHDNTVFLMSTDGISAAADYYYRRYIDPDSRGLTGDVDKWLNGKFTPKKFTDFTDPNGVLQPDGAIQFWIHVGDSFYGKNSKLPRLAKVILSVTVNTATCERYFSELSLIQTPRRNKLNFDKARRISIVRNKVRERNREERGGKDETREKKPLDPTERAKVQTPSSAELPTTSTAAANEVEDYTDTVEAVDFWLEAIADIRDEDCVAGEVLDEEWYVYDAETDPIPEAQRREDLPDANIATYPQESRLSGLRGQKVKLEVLFGCHAELTSTATWQ